MEENAMKQLTDRSDITDLVSRLGAVLDEGRFDDMPGLFVEEATAHTPGGTAVGRDAVVAQASKNHTPDQHVQHVITNVLVDLDDDDHARVRANLVVHFAPEPDDAPATLAVPVQFVLGEVYRFDVVRTAPGWRFRRVETIPVWMSGTRPGN
jgi:3-phenylpropionate/cinnamic acid dioxygenase small subunit